MTIRCPECGYENRDMYRFCGMCGATLRREPLAESSAPERPAVAEVAAHEPQIASSRSTPEPPANRDLNYLLEDEPPKSRVKLYLTFALLIVAAGLMIWHWQRDQHSSADASPAANLSSPAPETVAPSVTPTVNHSSTPKSESAPAEAKTSRPQTPQANSASTAATETPDVSAEKKSADGEVASVSPEPTDGEKPPETSVVVETDQPAATVSAPAVSAPAPKPKPEAKVVMPPAPVLRGDDKLVADGEKYLYGNGVPENCDLAQKNLKTAAGHSNPRALTLMGAMYATGHCVDRDLPTAYRWFAKALHQDPANSRVQQDLEILWRQMTPEEKQLAVKSGG